MSPTTTPPTNSEIGAAIERLRGAANLLRAAHDETDARTVDHLVQALRTEGTSLQIAVYLRDSVTGPQKARIRAFLASSSGVTNVRFENHQEAYHRFLRIFANEPSLTQHVSPDALPESFRATLADGAPVDEIEARVGRMPGVDRPILQPGYMDQVLQAAATNSTLLRTCVSPGGPSSP